MGCATHTEERKTVADGHIRGSGESAADLDTCHRNGGDDRAGSYGAGVSEKVGWTEDLRIIMVGSAVPAETSTAVDNGTIGQQNGRRMVVSGDSGRSKLRKCIGGGVEKLRDIIASCVAKGARVDLATHDEHGPIGKDDTVSERPLVGHVANSDGGSASGRSADSNDVGVGGSINILVGSSSTNGKNFAVYSIIHGRVTAHSITVACASAGSRLRAGICGAVPVHSFRWAGLEDIGVLPAEEPAVIISAVHPCNIRSVDVCI